MTAPAFVAYNQILCQQQIAAVADTVAQFIQKNCLETAKLRPPDTRRHIILFSRETSCSCLRQMIFDHLALVDYPSGRIEAVHFRFSFGHQRTNGADEADDVTKRISISQEKFFIRRRYYGAA